MLLNKKAVHIQARGQIYSQGPAQAMEYADSYVRLVLGLMGITDVQSIIAEGTSDPQRFSQILQQGIQLAKQQAVQFAQS